MKLSILIIFCLIFHLSRRAKCSSEIIVETQPRITLQKGRPGSLPCIDHTGGNIYTVSWLKGQTWLTARAIIVMDTHAKYGFKSGPGFEDGSYDIDDDFSLLMKEVGMENEGRYFCQVTPVQTGILARNHTDVDVVQITTDGNLTAILGETERLVCRCTSGKPIAVYWYKYERSGSVELKANKIVTNYRGSKTVDDSRYDIEDDYSMVIKKVTAEDETNFLCKVEFEDGYNGWNSTDIRVIALAGAPTVSYCQPTSTGRCTYTFFDPGGEGSTTEVICKVTNARPRVNVTWQDDLGNVLPQSHYVSENCGTYTVTSTLQLYESGIGDDFMCLAAGEALNGSVSVTMHVQVESTEKDGLSGGEIFAINFFVVIVPIVIVLIAIFLYRRKKSKQVLSPIETELQKLQQEIKDYTPGAFSPLEKREGRELPSNTRLALYGATSAGKSSLIRSFKYAVTDEYMSIEISDTQSACGVILTYLITDSVSIVDNRLRDLDENNVMDTIKKQIRGEDNLFLGVCIDCPILVFDAREPVTKLAQFLPAFVDLVRARYATHPPIIFTNLDDTSVRNDIDNIKVRVTWMGALDKKLFFVENITEKPTDIESALVRRLEFLRILKQLLQIADENMVYRVDQQEYGGKAEAAVPLL